MKKIISTILVFVLFVSLCACNTSDNTDELQSTETTTSSTKITDASTTTENSTPPTESEEEKELKAKKEKYETACKYLKEYLENGYFKNSWIRYEDNEARAYLYHAFESLGDYENSAEIFACFSSTDLVTSITLKQTDYLGNINEKMYESYQYDQKGNPVHGKFFYIMDVFNFYTTAPEIYTYHYEYDDNNRISSAALAYNGTTKCVATLKYDASDNLIEAIIEYADGGRTVMTYIYNAQNQIIESKIPGADYYSYTYTYDENGNLSETNRWYGVSHFKTQYIYDENNKLIKQIYTFTVEYSPDDIRLQKLETTDYEYDENGHLIKMTKTTEEPDYRKITTSQFIYTNDNNGNPISAELVEKVNGRNSYSSQILTYNYETFYLYNAK